jgi:enoyl-CoA hydratase/carnithine racemase
MSSDILVDERDGVAWITFNRPERHNSFDHAMLGEIRAGLEEIAHNPKIGVVVFTGAGDKAFCAGGYLRDLTEFDVNQARKLYDATWAVLSAMRRMPQPVIAAVNGYAVGGGNGYCRRQCPLRSDRAAHRLGAALRRHQPPGDEHRRKARARSGLSVPPV